ncbi:DUF2971 domain-containing protein [Aeromonas allosaccharophila]|uniref:DUF2971 domain-containing protein n=1 Tax=Aeromonas allosaccharophila TaxID=656 RepID=A0ABZ0FGZ7_9GAMM|nr:DUF2971 domain-containing protein [Aeromonas allosaccharophila]WOE68511.1 DUF2971 domain-containing protein [Aeromonas allosaccharophila]
MKTLYKYSDLLPLNYFDKPSIKISATEFLNDPFEYSTNENISLSIKNHLKNGGLSDMATILNKTFDVSIEMMLAFNGIISLSETPRNSLMWAHYAKQHNGICIGYKKDFLKHIEKTEDFHLVINTPQKVNYDNLRFETDFQYSELNTIEIDATTQHLLKKSDEWIYEKEHRCIIPYIKANRLIILSEHPKIDHIHASLDNGENPNFKIGADFNNVINGAIRHEYITKTDINNQYIINSNEINSAMLSVLQASKDCLFLIDIDPKSIESIYFGCKVSMDTIKPYFEKLHEKYKLYQFKISKKRFELIPSPLKADMF